MRKLSLFLVALAIAMVSCESQIENSTVTEPTVVTKSVKEITESTAKVVGQVAADGGSEVTERGVCWNTEGIPTILDYRVKDIEVGLGTFTSNLSDLEVNTTYYVRAYATNEVGVSYGEEMSFTTEKTEISENPENPENPETPNHEWIDLGLSVKWATCNVGANSPEEYGNYYAWGEIETKDKYLESNSLTYGLRMSELESLGYIDRKGNLTTSYDVATTNWGEGWRMPTYYEIRELYDECDMTWTILNGITGCYFTGPSGKSIFLPAAGCFDSGSYGVGRRGYYWSATPNDIDNSDDGTTPGHWVFSLRFNDEYCYDFDGGYRSDGCSVRPVFE